MTQVSRPFQIALGAMVLLAAVWFFALRGHSASSGEPGSSASSSSAPSHAPAPSTSAAAQAQSAAAPTPVYHGAAPGVEGLTRAIARAHEAVATSQHDAKQFEHQSAGEAGSTPQSTTTGAAASPRTAASAGAVHKASPTAPGRSLTGANQVPPRQAAVERELKQGNVVVVLFWNRRSSVDVAVHDELQLLVAVHHHVQAVTNAPMASRLRKAAGLELGSKIAVHEAPASQVASFGAITRSAPVYQTPTMLIINGHGKTTTLTGLTDAFSIEQAIDESRHS